MNNIISSPLTYSLQHYIIHPACIQGMEQNGLRSLRDVGILYVNPLQTGQVLQEF